jgi:hypothetical protein
MIITTRGVGIPKYNQKRGLMSIDDSNNVFWVKMTIAPISKASASQYIIEFSKFEVARIINAGLKDAEIVATCKRQDHGLIEDFLK